MCRMRYPKWILDKEKKFEPYLEYVMDVGQVTKVGTPPEIVEEWLEFKEMRSEWWWSHKYY